MTNTSKRSPPSSGRPSAAFKTPSLSSRKRILTPEQREANRLRCAAHYAANKTKRHADAAAKYHGMNAAEREQHRLTQKAWRESKRTSGSITDAVTAHTAAEIKKVLGGAERSGHRENRGFVPWNPQDHSIKLVNEAKEVLEEYREHLPLTIRQIMYRLMDAHGYQKKDIETKLYRVTQAARRAELIPMESIRDDGGAKEVPVTWEDADEWLAAIRRSSKSVRLDRQEGQPKRLVLYCEAAGMVPQLHRVADEYGIPVLSSGGTNSITETWLLGRDHDSTEVLYIGDLDPSGVTNIFIPLAEDVSAFGKRYDHEIDFTWLAVTPQQITGLRLDKTPLLKKPRVAYAHGFTVQAEAIAPDDLARIVRKAITDRLDQDAYDSVLEREVEMHAELEEQLS